MNKYIIIRLWIFITVAGTIVSGFGAKEEKIHHFPSGDFWNEVVSGGSPQIRSISPTQDKLPLESIEEKETLKNGLDWSLKSDPKIDEESYNYEDEPTSDYEHSNSVEDDYEDNKLSTDEYDYYYDETEKTPSSPASKAREGRQDDDDMFHNWNLEGSIPGIPEADYPVYVTVPQTGFNCDEHPDPGFYGDVDARCQVFHICQEDGRHHSFLCPVGTVFNQKHFVCDWWFRFNCTDSPKYYELNSLLYKVKGKDNQQGRKSVHFHRSVKSQMDKMKHLMNGGKIGASRGRRMFRSNTPETITETQKTRKTANGHQRKTTLPSISDMNTSKERLYGKGHVIVIRRPLSSDNNYNFNSNTAGRTGHNILKTVAPASTTTNYANLITSRMNSSNFFPVENEYRTLSTSLAEYADRESTQENDTPQFLYHTDTKKEYLRGTEKSQLHVSTVLDTSVPSTELYTQNNSENGTTLFSESRHDLALLSTEAVNMHQMNDTDPLKNISEIKAQKFLSGITSQESTEVLNEPEDTWTTDSIQSSTSSTKERAVGTSMEMMEHVGENITDIPASTIHSASDTSQDLPLENIQDNTLVRQNRRNLNGKIRRQRIRVSPKYNHTLKRKMLSKKRPEWKRISLFRTKTMRKPEARFLYSEMLPRMLQEVNVRRNYWSSLRRNSGIRNVSWVLPRKKMLRRRMGIGEMKLSDSSMMNPKGQLHSISMGESLNHTMSYIPDLDKMFFMRLMNDDSKSGYFNKLNSTENGTSNLSTEMFPNIQFLAELPEVNVTPEEQKMLDDYHKRKKDDRSTSVVSPGSEIMNGTLMSPFKNESELMVSKREEAVKDMLGEDKYQGAKCDLACIQVLHNLLKIAMSQENESDSTAHRNRSEIDLPDPNRNGDNGGISSFYLSPVDFIDSTETNCDGNQEIMIGSVNGFSVIIDSGGITKEKTVKLRKCKFPLPESIGSEDIPEPLTDHSESTIGEKEAFKISSSEKNSEHLHERNIPDEFTFKPEDYKTKRSDVGSTSFSSISIHHPRNHSDADVSETHTTLKGESGRSQSIGYTQLIEQILSAISSGAFIWPREEHAGQQHITNSNQSLSGGVPLDGSVKAKRSSYASKNSLNMSNYANLMPPHKMEDGYNLFNASGSSKTNHRQIHSSSGFENTSPEVSSLHAEPMSFMPAESRKDGLNEEMQPPRTPKVIDAYSRNRQLSENGTKINSWPLSSDHDSRDFSSFIKEIMSKLTFDEKTESLERFPKKTIQSRHSMVNPNKPTHSSRISYVAEERMWNKDSESREDTTDAFKPNQNSEPGDSLNKHSWISDTAKGKDSRSPDSVPMEQSWMGGHIDPYAPKILKETRNSHKDFTRNEEWNSDSDIRDGLFSDSRDLNQDWSNPKAFKQSWTSESKNMKANWQSGSVIPGKAASSDSHNSNQGWTLEQKKSKEDWMFETKTLKSDWNTDNAKNKNDGLPDSQFSGRSWSSSSIKPKRDWSSASGEAVQSWQSNSGRPRQDVPVDARASRRNWASESKDFQNDWSSSSKKPMQDWMVDKADNKYDWWSDSSNNKQDWLMDSGKSKDDWSAGSSDSKRDWSSDAAKSSQNWPLDTGKSKQEWTSDSRKDWDGDSLKGDWPSSSTKSKQDWPSHSTRAQYDRMSDTASQKGQKNWSSDSKTSGRDWASVLPSQEDWQDESRKKMQNRPPDSRTYKKDWSSASKRGQRSDWSHDSMESKGDWAASSNDFAQNRRSAGQAPILDWSLDSKSDKRDWSLNRATGRKDWSTDLQPGSKDWSSSSKADKNDWTSDSQTDANWSSDLHTDKRDWSNTKTSKDDWSFDSPEDKNAWSSDSRTSRDWSSDSQTDKNAWPSDSRPSRDWSSDSQTDKNAWPSDSRPSRDWSSDSQTDKNAWPSDSRTSRDWSDSQVGKRGWTRDSQEGNRDWSFDMQTGKKDWSSNSPSDEKNWSADSATAKGDWSSSSRNFKQGRTVDTARSKDRPDIVKQDWSSRSKDPKKGRQFNTRVTSPQRPSTPDDSTSDSFSGTVDFKKDWSSSKDSSSKDSGQDTFGNSKTPRQDWAPDSKAFTQKVNPSPPKDWSRDFTKGSQTWTSDSKRKISKNMPAHPKGTMQGRRFDSSENAASQWSFDSKSDSRDWPPSRRGDKDWSRSPDQRNDDWASDTSARKGWDSAPRNPKKDWGSDSSDGQSSWSPNFSSKGKPPPLPSWNTKPDGRPGNGVSKDHSDRSSSDEDQNAWDSRDWKKGDVRSPKQHTPMTRVRGSDSRPPKDKVPKDDWKMSTSWNSDGSSWRSPDSQMGTGSETRTPLKGGQSWNDVKVSEKGSRGTNRMTTKGDAGARPSWSSSGDDMKNIRWSVQIGEDGKLANGWIPITGKPRRRSNSSFSDSSPKNASVQSDGGSQDAAMKAWGSSGMNLMKDEEESLDQNNGDRTISSEESKKIFRWIPSLSQKLSESYRSDSRKVKRRESGEGTGEWSARFDIGSEPTSGWIPILNIKHYYKKKINGSVNSNSELEDLKEISEDQLSKADEKIIIKSENNDEKGTLDKHLVFTSTVSVVKPNITELSEENVSVNTSRIYSNISKVQNGKETFSGRQIQNSLPATNDTDSNVSLADSNEKRPRNVPRDTASSTTSISFENKNLKVIPFSQIHPHLDEILKARSSIQEHSNSSSVSVPFGMDIWSGRPYILRSPKSNMPNRTMPENLISNGDKGDEASLHYIRVQVGSYPESHVDAARYGNKREAENHAVQKHKKMSRETKQMISFSISDGRFFPRGTVFSDANEKLVENNKAKNIEILNSDTPDESDVEKLREEKTPVDNKSSTKRQKQQATAHIRNNTLLRNERFDESKYLGVKQFSSAHNTDTKNDNEMDKNRGQKSAVISNVPVKSNRRLVNVSSQEINKVIEYKMPRSLRGSEKKDKMFKLPLRKGDLKPNPKISRTKYSSGANAPTKNFVNSSNLTNVNYRVPYKIINEEHFV